MSSKRHTGQLIWLLAKTDFKLRYQGSVLGFLWALLKPLFIFGILHTVFVHLFGMTVENYALKLLLAILLWTFFAEGTMVGLHSLMSKGHILTKISFPRWIVVVSAWLQSVMTFAITLLIFFGAFFFSGLSVSIWQVVVFLLYIAALLLLVLGFSFLTAPLFLRYRDLNQIWDVLLLGGFYAAPIIYPLEMLPTDLRMWLYVNPMTFLIEHARTVLFTGEFSRLDHHVLYGLVLVLGFVFAWGVFQKFQRKIAELL